MKHSLYVVGFSVRAKGLRTLKLQRIKSAKLTGKPFVKPDDFSLEHYFHRSLWNLLGRD